VIASILLAGLLLLVPQDAWQRARGLAPGAARAEALLVALGEVGPGELAACLQVSYEEFLNETRAYRLDLALPLAEAMHRRALAPWSAISLALASSRAGRPERAREVLLEQLGRATDRVTEYDLLERLGLVALGAGDRQEARKFLGAAFARGSANAGVVLARLALAEGRRETSRAVFRSLLGEEPSQSWAHRGWGLSMLPGTEPAPRGR